MFPKGLGGFPNGFGEVCCQAAEFYTLSSESFGDEDSKSQCMPVANHNHAVYVSKVPWLRVETMALLGTKCGSFEVIIW